MTRMPMESLRDAFRPEARSALHEIPRDAAPRILAEPTEPEQDRHDRRYGSYASDTDRRSMESEGVSPAPPV
ncbi:hypothetical protein [Streptomyces sp. NPDC101150]|uniref:hypothetical protein n=1 Tax=Streptomyces sp. NPDC101150 TaxID=3366114 RepID=UPI00381A3041